MKRPDRSDAPPATKAQFFYSPGESRTEYSTPVLAPRHLLEAYGWRTSPIRSLFPGLRRRTYTSAAPLRKYRPGPERWHAGRNRQPQIAGTKATGRDHELRKRLDAQQKIIERILPATAAQAADPVSSPARSAAGSALRDSAPVKGSLSFDLGGLTITPTGLVAAEASN
jgi:hypothetical protein